MREREREIERERERDLFSERYLLIELFHSVERLLDKKQ